MNSIYALVLQACITGLSCNSPVQVATFENHYDCAVAGYTRALELHKKIGENKDKNMPFAVKFWCAKIPKNDI